jgi:hypothetical protein
VVYRDLPFWTFVTFYIQAAHSIQYKLDVKHSILLLTSYRLENLFETILLRMFSHYFYQTCLCKEKPSDGVKYFLPLGSQSESTRAGTIGLPPCRLVALGLRGVRLDGHYIRKQI